MIYRILFTGRAKRDLRIIRDWISGHSRRGALTWVNALDAACKKLATSTTRGDAAPEANDLGVELRQLIFQTRRGRPYWLLFVLKDRQIAIVAIRGPGQDLIQPDDFDLP